MLAQLRLGIGVRRVAVVAVVIGVLGALTPAAHGFTFTQAPGSPYQLIGFPESVGIGDFNGDRLPDIAVGTFTASPSNPGGNQDLSVLPNGGDGFRSAASDTPLGDEGGGPSVAAADFNGDGKLDVVAADNAGVWILIGNGDGTFSPTPDSPVSDGHQPAQVVAGDFNGDGKPDLAILNQDDTISVLLGNGDGTFKPAPGSPITVGNGRDAIAVGDFNGDGKPDLAVLSSSPGPSSDSGTLTVLLGKGDGSFTPAPGSPIALNGNPGSLAVADFNGDGKPDIAIAADTGNDSSGSVIALLGRGDGSFTPAPGSPIGVPDSGLGEIVAADFNDDGRQDLAFAGTSDTRSGGVYLFLGDGTGQFRAARGSPFPVSTPTGSFTSGPEVLATTTTGGRTALVLSPGYYGYAGELQVLLAPLPSDPPTAALAVSETPASSGVPVKLDATASSDPLDRPIVDYRWDLGSGRFGVDTGATPTLTHAFSTAGAYTLRVRVTNSAGETAIATARLTVRAPGRDAVVSGSVQRCGGPAPGRCFTSTIRRCATRHSCITSDRVAALNADGRRVAVTRLHRARFSLRLAPGRYTLKLLGDGRRVHGRVMGRIHVIARANRTTRVKFHFDVP